MSQFDGLADKAKGLAQEHGDKVEQYSDQGLDQAGNVANEKSGGKFSDQIDQGKQAADERVGDNSQ